VIWDLAIKYPVFSGVDHAPVRRNPLLNPQPVELEENESTSVTEELLDGKCAVDMVRRRVR
jgi:hypothetical protein